MRPDSARPIGLPVGNFGVNSPRACTTVSTNREDVHRDCRLLLTERY